MALIHWRLFSRFAPMCRGRRSVTKRRLPEACQDQVYFLNQRREPTHRFETALRALRCYAIGADEDEWIELSLRLNMSIKKDSRRGPFHGMVLFPYPLSKQKRKRILVIAEDDLTDSARQAGADVVGGKELVLQLEEGNIKFDVCLSSESMYDSLKPLQQTLKSKMPHPRRGTVTNDLAPAIKRVLQEQEYNVDKEGNLNTVVGRLSFEDNAISENVKMLLKTVMVHKVPKGAFIKAATLSSTKGPGYYIDFSPFLRELQPRTG